MHRGKFAPVTTLREGDIVKFPDRKAIKLARIQRAQGRKPPQGGENLRLIASNGEKVLVHDSKLLRIVRG